MFFDRNGRKLLLKIKFFYFFSFSQIVSGCEWGNILLWEEGLIALEICQKNRQPCHTKPITQFEYINGELISVGKYLSDIRFINFEKMYTMPFILIY
jgi:hypothetical protein